MNVFFSSSMNLAHRAPQAVAEALIVEAELAVPIGTLAVRDVIFLPQQLQGHGFAFEILMYVGKVRLFILFARHGLSEQRNNSLSRAASSKSAGSGQHRPRWAAR